MSKKNTFAPFILFSGMDIPGPVDDEGDGTDHGGVDPIGGQNAFGPVTFADWASRFGNEANGGSFEAYGQWWADNGFSMDAWNEFNPNVSFTWGPESDT